jgi:hypothetical protein
MRGEAAVFAHACAAQEGLMCERSFTSQYQSVARTLVDAQAGVNHRVKTGPWSGSLSRSRAAISGRPASGPHRRPLIREKIIGHGMRPIVSRFDVCERVRKARGAIALLQQPARQHGGGILLQPLVKKSHDFLAEVGGMAQARQFVALQRISRGRKQELPRWLGSGIDHGRLQSAEGRTSPR